ncbi:MAG TPA: glucosaminidase domain-containing protein [Candidatus Paceibacterota bacterium]|nr:glucosaminidase domain-containing protein [Candidatus Paceibacterota bacterium]
MKKYIFYAASLFVVHGTASNSEEMNFIQKYVAQAKWEQFRTGVPACITLAQAMLESQNGTSDLAKSANNYFGIKVGSDWNGPFVYHDDDRPHEKFRKYITVAQSFHNHSDLLRGKELYSFLFRLDPNNYIGWAQGLHRAGYATNKHYARLLIDIIERYNLVQYNLNNEDITRLFLVCVPTPSDTAAGDFYLRYLLANAIATGVAMAAARITPVPRKDAW